MPAFNSDGNTKLWFVPTISNTSAPTTSELNAGTALEGFTTPDGWDAGTSTDTVDTTTLAGGDNTEDVGRRTDAPSLTYYAQGVPGTSPDSVFTGNAAGYMVERIGIAATTAWASSQKLRVFPVKAKHLKRPATAKNARATVVVEFVKTAAAVDPATVA